MSAEESGSWRLVASDAEENPESQKIMAQFETSQTSSAAKAYPADRDALALPRNPPSNIAVGNEGKVILEFLSESADTIESEECGGTIPIILENVKTGARQHTNLRIGDAGLRTFSGFNSTNDVVVNTSTFQRLGAHQIPAGHRLMLDVGKPVHGFFGDDT